MLDQRVASAMADVFSVPASEVTALSGPDSVANWDSVGHLDLILHLEEVFGVRFAVDEIPLLNRADRLEAALRALQALP